MSLIVPTVISHKVPDQNLIFIQDKTGKRKILSYDTLRTYLRTICQKTHLEHLNVDKLTENVYPKLKTTNTLDDICNQIVSSASEMGTDHYDYPCIATWILISRLHQNTHADYLEVVRTLYTNVNKKGKPSPIVTDSFFDFVAANHEQINMAFKYERDFNITVFGYRTLERSYLKRSVDGVIIERPQHLYMRVAIAIHYRTNRLDLIIKTYDMLSQGYFVHATPTLFNAGTTHEQLSSCFLLGIEDDMNDIGECWKDSARISKSAGGIGIHVSNIRVNGAYIHSTQGRASGMRVLTVFNQISRYADQAGKRAGSFAMYLEPWHNDIMFFLDLKKNTGAETERARDLFYALMVNDIFMKRVKNDEMWSLMCPSECPDLLNKYGKEFTRIYENYEKQGNYIKQIPARDIWFKMMEIQIETGTPYILHKGHINQKSNQINIGVINGSNLCVSGDTLLLTSKGYRMIGSMEDQIVDIWNGNEFSSVTIKKTGNNQQLIKIKFSNGATMKCTPYHKFYIQNHDNIVEKMASELVSGQALLPIDYPIIKTDDNKSALNMLANLIDISGEIYVEWNTCYLCIYGTDKIFLDNLRLQLTTLGCNPVLDKVTNSSEKKYRVTISSTDMYQLIKLGLKTNNVTIDRFEQIHHQNKHLVVVEKITYLGKKEDTFCFTEPNRHMGVFNGIVAGNCSEIVEVSSSEEYAVCNLASICLPKFVKFVDGKPWFDYQELYRITKLVTINLNNVIDINFYPVEKARISNMKHRPIGIGVQGLADVFALFETPFDSELARDLNKKIFETIYFGAMTESMLLAQKYDKYQTFDGSPISQGKFQFDLWGIDRKDLSGMWDWNGLEEQIKLYGVRNSLTTTCMPTASTSQIMGNNECLVSGTPIYLSCGLTKNIEDMLPSEHVIGWNNTNLVDAVCSEKINKGIKRTLKLVFENGYEIKCTSDHKFLTYDKEWITAKDITIGTKIMAGVTGTYDRNFDDEEDFELRIGKYNFRLNNEKNRFNTLAFARVVGYVIAKGKFDSMNQSISIIVENKYDGECLLRDIIEFDNDDLPDVEDDGEKYIFKLDPTLTRAIMTVCNLVNSPTNVILGKMFIIPTFISRKTCPRSVIREFLAGYFGGIGKTPKLKFVDGEYTFDKIKFKIMTEQKFIKQIYDFFVTLDELMMFIGMHQSDLTIKKNSMIIGYDNTITLIVPDTTKFLKDIGFRYCINKSFKLTVIDVWNKSNKIIKTNILEFLESTQSLHWFIGDATIIDKDSLELPYFAMSLTNKMNDDTHHVWDINVKHTHSFIANGLVVHNCIEPYTANIYSRSTLAGDYYIVNKHLMKKLMSLNLWDSNMVDLIKYYEGSIQEIPNIPDDIKKIYRTAFEIPQKSIIDMSADRGPFVDQTQSLNLFIDKPDFARLNSCLFYGWEKGLKTGMYYLRSKPSSEANKFGINIDTIKEIEEKNGINNSKQLKSNNQSMKCRMKRQNGEVCIMCSS